jgi:indolepyruvate decarboxylase
VAQTVVQYVLSRLRDIGIKDVFGVPGDFSFPICDAIVQDPSLRWIGCCNELNAAYAADGYARISGLGAVCTTYGVGELAALAGIAGAYAEHLPVFHLVGAPGVRVQSSRAIVHHTLGNGEYGLFQRMSEPAVVASAVMTPHNAALETERLIAEALYHRRPVYMAFPGDVAQQPITGLAQPVTLAKSNPDFLEAATDAIATVVEKAASACVLPGILVTRTGRRADLHAFINASGLPFATMFMDKSVLDEQHPAYVGMYDGKLMNEDVRQFVENCEQVIAIGTVNSDFNSGAFTSRIDPARLITIGHHLVRVGGKTFSSVEMGDVLASLALKLTKKPHGKRPAVSTLGPIMGIGNDAITAAALYPRWEQFLRPNDIVIGETGTASMGLGFARMPRGASFHNQTLWGSIGWATPASFGAAAAAPDRRVVLFTGDGSHQLTVQEISQFCRLNLKPVIFVLNNNGYLIERLLCKDPNIAYNDIAQWKYSELPRVLGCDDWYTARAATCGELDAALAKASAATTGVYIEVVTGAYEASPLAAKLHDGLQAIYKS